MDASDALDTLDLPRGERYYDQRIPCSDDSRIGRALKAFTGAHPVWQAAFREAIDLDRADLLCAWSERMAALAVRLDSAQPLVLGLDPRPECARTRCRPHPGLRRPKLGDTGVARPLPDARVDQKPLRGEPVRVDIDVPAPVYGGPVVDAGEDLAHRGSLAPAVRGRPR